MTRALRWFPVFMSMLACSSASTPSGADDKSADKSADPAVTSEPTTNVDASSEAKPAPPPPKPDASKVEAKPQEAVAVEPATVPISAITPVDAAVVWREVQTLDEAITFVNLIGGVLGQASTDYYAFDETGVISKRYVETPAGELIGYWPDNLWTIEIGGKPLPNDRSGEIVREIRLMRLRNESRWVPQDLYGEQVFEDNGQDYRIGNKGGLLVAEIGYSRVAGGSESPVGGLCRGDVIEFVETRAGKLYTVCRAEGAAYAQVDCVDQACVDEKAVKLPFGDAWTFSLQVPRQRNSVSLAAVVEHEGAERPHLLHYETGGWKLETTTAKPEGMWPTKDGGLWTRIGAELLHRDPEGGWRRISLPEGAAQFSAAMQGDQSELVLAVVVDGKTAVFATQANAQAPAPTPSVEPVSG